MSGRLGLNFAPDQDHIDKYPLAALGDDAPTGVPVVLGVNWYENFDKPEQVDGVWRIGAGDLGSVRGGHCFTTVPPDLTDEEAWWRYYNQGDTGHCVGFGNARAQSLLKGVEFNATWLYNAARNAEGNHSDEEGSTVRAAMRVLQHKGAVPKGAGGKPVADDGISAYRWATNWDEVRATLGLADDVDGVPMTNNWGVDFPFRVILEDAAGERLLQEGGEAAVFTER